MNAPPVLPLHLPERVFVSPASETEQTANNSPEEHSEPHSYSFTAWSDEFAQHSRETKLLHTLHESEKDRQELVVNMMHSAELSKSQSKNAHTAKPLWELCEEVIYGMVDQHNCLELLPYTQLQLKSSDRARLEPPNAVPQPAPAQVQMPSPPLAAPHSVATPSLPTTAPLAPSDGSVVGVAAPRLGAKTDLFAHLPHTLIPGFTVESRADGMATLQQPHPNAHASSQSTTAPPVPFPSDAVMSVTWQGKCWEVLLNNFEELRTSHQLHQLDREFVEDVYIRFVRYRLDPDRAAQRRPAADDPLKLPISTSTLTEIMEYALIMRMETLWKVVANEFALFSEDRICEVLAAALRKDLMLLPERCLAFIDDRYFDIINRASFSKLPSELQAAIIGHKQNAIKNFYSEDERSRTTCEAYTISDYLDEEDFVPEWYPDPDEDGYASVQSDDEE